MDKYYPYNAVNGDRTHDADDLAKIIQAMITDGVELVTGEMMQVTEKTGFDVTVKPGTCIVQGRIGIIESNKTLSVPAPSSALDRIDVVAARADYTGRMTRLVYLTGTPASTPTAPALKNDVYGYDIPLAEIRVNKNATKITRANITDRRKACSFIIPKNTDAFFAQLRAKFDEWFEVVQDTLGENQAGNLLNLINGKQPTITSANAASVRTALGLGGGAQKDIRAGSVGVTVAANSYADTTVTFSPAFGATPAISATIGNASAVEYARVGAAPTAASATIRVYNDATTQRTITIYWIAVNR